MCQRLFHRDIAHAMLCCCAGSASKQARSWKVDAQFYITPCFNCQTQAKTPACLTELSLPRAELPTTRLIKLDVTIHYCHHTYEPMFQLSALSKPNKRHLSQRLVPSMSASTSGGLRPYCPCRIQCVRLVQGHCFVEHGLATFAKYSTHDPAPPLDSAPVQLQDYSR